MSLKKVGLVMIILMAMLHLPVFAQSDVRFSGIGGRLFYVDFEGSSAIGFGAVLGFGQLNQNLFLEGNADVWTKSYGSAGFKSKLRDVALSGTIKFKFSNVNSMLTPFVSGGAAIHMVNTKVELPSNDYTVVGDMSDTDIRIGLDLGGGLEYALNPNFDIVGTVLYRIVSDVNQFFISGGFLIRL